MIKSLDFIENQVPEQLLIEGEDLLHSGELLQLESTIKHLFLFRVFENSTSCEIEVLTSPKYIKNYTCDCAEFDPDGLCSHVVSALLFIRRKRTKEEIAKTWKKQAQKKLNSKLDIDAIFDFVSQDDIKAFVKQFSKSNSKFATALRINFARKVPTANPEIKYAQLLNKLLKPITKADEKYPAASINFYVKQATELFEQYKDAKSLGSFVEAATLLQLLIKKTAYARTFRKYQNDSLDELDLALHEEIEFLLKEQLAPALRDNLISSILEIVSASFYDLSTVKSNIAYHLYIHGTNEECIKLSDALFEKLQNNKDRDQIVTISVLILLLSEKVEIEAPEIYSCVRTEHMQEISNALLKENCVEGVKQFINRAEEYDHLSKFAYDNIKLLVARKSDNQEVLIDLLAKKFFASGHVKYVKELLEFDSKKSRKALVDIRSFLFGKEKYNPLKLDISFALEDYDLLVDQVIETSNYSSMDKYINTMQENKPKIVEMFFRKYIKKCSADHFHSHRNHVQLMDVADSLNDPGISNNYRNALRSQRKKLEELLMSEE